MKSLKLLGLSVLMAGAVAFNATAKAADDFTVTLLGTASPAPRPDRMGPSTLVEVNGQRLLFDAGRGAPIRLWQLHIPVGSLDATFLTHFHSDHVNGLPDIWLTGWLGAPYARRDGPFRLIGPSGTQALMDGLEQAYQGDIKIREADEKLSPDTIKADVTEFDKPGVVWNKDGVKVTAFQNSHGEHIDPSVGYKVEYDGHSVVISGDTKPVQSVVDAARGADLLIHEVAAAREPLMQIPTFQRVMGHHTTPEQAGEIFAEAKPKLAVYTHLVMLSNKDNPEPTLEDIVAGTRKNYDGPLVVGSDLMSFEIGDQGVAVVPHDIH